LVRKDPITHKTGRDCEEKNCKGELLGTTVAFQESLPEKELEKAIIHSYKSDLSIVIGSSMRVSPAYFTI
jgi:NAD-dependent SIR2 family protein deacetylase